MEEQGSVVQTVVTTETKTDYEYEEEEEEPTLGFKVFTGIMDFLSFMGLLTIFHATFHAVRGEKCPEIKKKIISPPQNPTINV